MRKIIYLIIALIAITTTYALGDNIYYHFTGGSTQINATDVCLSTGACLSQAGGSYTWNLLSDSGEASITSGNNVNFTGGTDISTSYNAGKLTITYTGSGGITAPYNSDNFTSDYYSIFSRYGNSNFTSQHLIQPHYTLGLWSIFNFTTENISNWNSAFSWGDHSLAGYTIGTHTNRTDTEINSLIGIHANSMNNFSDTQINNWIDTNITNHETTYKHGNTTSEILAISGTHTNRTDSEILALSGTHTNLTEIDVESYFEGSRNITYINGIFAINLSCEQITGSTDLCDGSDDSGSVNGLYNTVNFTSDLLDVTYLQNYTGHQCASGYVVKGYFQNGTPVCVQDSTGDGGDLGTDVVDDVEMNYTDVTLSDFTNDAGYIVKNDAFLYDSDNFTTEHTADIHYSLTFLSLSNSSVYLDDTTINNCSVDGSCPNVHYESELRTHTNKTDAEIEGLCYNLPSEVYTATPHTNRSDTDITDLCYDNVGELPTHTNRTDTEINSLIGIHAATMNNVSDTNVNSWIQTNISDHETNFKHGNTTAEILSVAYTHTNLSESDVESFFEGSRNLSYANGVYFINLSCEQITGSADLCDGDDAAGGGGTSIWLDKGNYAELNDSYAVHVQVRGYIQADNWTNITITESQISDLSHTIDTTINNCSVSNSCSNIHYESELRTMTNRTDTDIQGLCYDNSAELPTYTNRTDADIEGLCYNTPAEVHAATTHTNLTETNVESFFEGSRNLSYSNGVYFINLSCESITGSADLCDGDDAAGGGGTSIWLDQGNYAELNSSYATHVQVRGYIQADNWTNVTITESQISDLSHTTDTTIANCSVDGSCSAIHYDSELRTHTNRSNTDITDLCYDTPAELPIYTNRTDGDITALCYDTEAELTTDLNDNYVGINAAYLYNTGNFTTQYYGITSRFGNANFSALHTADLHYSLTFLSLLNSSVYLDDTTINNCSVSGSCDAIHYDSELRTHTNRTDVDITDLCYNTATEVWTATPHTNRTDVDITGLCYDTPAEIWGATTHTNRTDGDITGLCYNTPTEVWTATTHTNRTNADIEALSINNVADDTTPQLAANLDAQNYNITTIDCIVFTNGFKIGSDC